MVDAYVIVDDDDANESNGCDSRRRDEDRFGANVILHGPPGTGKTVAAKIVAKTLGLNLMFVRAENVSSAYRSETEKNLRSLYDNARRLVTRRKRNVLLLMDEIDGLVKNRERSDGDGVSSVDYSVLTTFLTILEPQDGTDNSGIFSVFTTNRLEAIDDAFRRRCVAVFFGRVTSPDDSLALAKSFFGSAVIGLNELDPRGDAAERLVARLVDWVPGDYARFKRERLKGMRLRLLAFETNLDRAIARPDEFASRPIVERKRARHDASVRDANVVVDDDDDAGQRQRSRFAYDADDAATSTAVLYASRPRRLDVALPKVHLSDLLREISTFSPITSSERYRSYATGETS